jgi:restriction-modification enzyme MmeI-like protein
VFGNPPFAGQSFQSHAQREQMATLIDAVSGRPGSLDYVTAWFMKAGHYVRNSRARIAFVATNSITQGEQVAQLWPILFERYGLEIAFAHRTFEWLSDARGRAHVHCVIIGLTKREDEPKEKRLFSYADIAGDPVESRHIALSPYLFDASGLSDRHVVVRECRTPLGNAAPLRMGSKIVDGGSYIFNEDERNEFLALEPQAKAYLCPLVGSEEYINGGKRWILSLNDVDPTILRKMPMVVARINAVKQFRANSKKSNTRELAQTPTRFEVMTIPARTFLVVPEVSSERRDYVPIGWLSPPTIPSNLVHTLIDAGLWDFGIVTSRMHMAWLRNIGGRLKNDYRYSIGIVYNPFPWPEADEKARAKIRTLAQAVLDARKRHPDSTLADLYDPDTMPPGLRKAHMALDTAVDRLYRKEPFLSDRERVEHLFKLYENLAAPVLAVAAAPRDRDRVGRKRK